MAGLIEIQQASTPIAVAGSAPTIEVGVPAASTPANISGTATFIPVFDAADSIDDSPLFIDDVVTPTKITIPINVEVTDSDLILIAPNAGNGGLVSSPDLILRANYDADATAGITPTGFDAVIRHVMLVGGASPNSKLSFFLAGAEQFNIQKTATSVVFSRTDFTKAFLQLDTNRATLAYGGGNLSVNSVGSIELISVGFTRAHYNVSGTGRVQWRSTIVDSGTAVGFTHFASGLDKDSFTAGALHTKWIDAGSDQILALLPDGVVDFLPSDALGGGAAPTFGTIGGTGPATAAQSKWLKIKIGGVDHWLPAWV